MKKLGQRNYKLISRSMKQCGFKETMDGLMYEEEMYVDEINEIIEFLTWLVQINRPFGKANYEQRFKEFKSGEKAPDSFFQVVVNFPGEKPKNYEGFANYWPDHQHIKRISGDHTNKLQIAARLCSNLSDPNLIQVIEVGGTYIQDYDVTEMAQFVKDNQKAIQDIRLIGYDEFPSEFF